MVKLTRQQREALAAKFSRMPIYAQDDHLTTSVQRDGKPPLTYRQFRNRVHVCFDGSGAVMIHWCGMWLGIERDGYTHS